MAACQFDYEEFMEVMPGEGVPKIFESKIARSDLIRGILFNYEVASSVVGSCLLETEA